ncbi:hypothetical protein JTB14_009498 [Gonioctena quinquepunctata]|nr:hypothetical protein JTB14_009498 [Gonioctena quinquepunctata]
MDLTQNFDKMAKELQLVSEEKQQLSESLELSHKELQKVKKARNEILESQTKIMKEAENGILTAHQSSVEARQELQKRIETSENQKKQLEADQKKLREAYVSVVTANSKLELEIVNLRRKIEDKNARIADFSQIKEAYEKLLEENSRLMAEVDTVKYKRSRDKEEFVNLLKKEREEANSREGRRVQEVRNEYDGKVEKMKEKMLKLYREEVHKEIKKLKMEPSETAFLLQKTIDKLNNELFEAEQKIHLLRTERDMLRIKESENKKAIQSSRESLRSLREKEPSGFQMGSTRNSVMSRNSITSRNSDFHKWLPANIGPNLEMEDEDDDFNNKYLADLKAGRCLVESSDPETNANRFSELAWRNSLVPPHLKSSYPAEMQFVSPSHFKEDDIKSGNVELDDSLSKLLPGEKPRQKKDFGTTSYKKPGPPTPSKNGGRLSLQGNEVQPLREHNDRSPAKKITPSRIKALFMGRTSLRENSENQATTPKTNKRLSIFRKQK